MGNDTEDPLTITGGTELFGFGTGSFDFKLVHGGVRDVSGLAWRLLDDTGFISWNKKVMTVCAFMHRCAVSNGLADVGIQDHVIEPKMSATDSWVDLFKLLPP